MDNKKKVSGKAKKNRKPFIAPSVKKVLITASIILALVITVGGFFAYTAGLPAMVLTGAEIKLTPEGGKAKVVERIRVNELNYLFQNSSSQLEQYGWLQQGMDLDSVYDEATGKTYREFVFEFACENILRSIMIEKEARNDKNFSPEAVQYSVEKSIEQLREAVDYNTQISGNALTADQYLSQVYGPGINVSAFASFIERQMIVDEYMQYLQQEAFMPTAEELASAVNAAGTKTELLTFRYYMFNAKYETDATEEQIAVAKAEARSKADDLISRVTDETSFRDICEELAGEAAAASFADGKDPTVALDFDSASVESRSLEMADYLYSPDRAAGDMAVFDIESGSVAVYYLSRRLDTKTTLSYRIIHLNYEGEFDIEGNVLQSEKDKTNQKANELMGKITDEKSFASLAKKYTDNEATRLSGGLVSGITPDSLFTAENPTLYEQQLAGWLIDRTRMPGDRVVLESTDFLAVIYFVENVPSWQFRLRSSLIDAEYELWMKTIDDLGVLSYEIKYKNIDFATS